MREKSSTGPLAKGLSIPVFSHGRGRALNRFLGAQELGAAFPGGQTVGQTPISGKPRLKSVSVLSVPGLRRVAARAPPKRLSTQRGRIAGGGAGMSCKLKVSCPCPPTHSNNYSTVPHPGLGSAPLFLVFFRPLPRRCCGDHAVHAARAGGGGVFAGGPGAGAGGVGAQPMGAAAAARGGGRGGRAGGVAAARGGGRRA